VLRCIYHSLYTHGKGHVTDPVAVFADFSHAAEALSILLPSRVSAIDILQLGDEIISFCVGETLCTHLNLLLNCELHMEAETEANDPHFISPADVSKRATPNHAHSYHAPDHFDFTPSPSPALNMGFSPAIRRSDYQHSDSPLRAYTIEPERKLLHVLDAPFAPQPRFGPFRPMHPLPWR
jgi:hypothetical protein